MWSDIPAQWLTGGGFLTAIAALYWGLYTGRIATGNVVDEKNEEIRENRATIRELLAQNTKLIQENEATTRALEALRQVAEGGGSR